MNNYEKKEKIIDEAKKETDTKLTDSIANESIKQIQKNQNKICSLKYEFQEETIWKYREEIDIMNTLSFICERDLYGYDK